MITDGFQKIVIYDNKVTEATAAKTANGYMLNLTLDIKKESADGAGKETNVACNDYMEIGIYKDSKTQMQLSRVKLKNGINKLSIPVSAAPYKVVLDPHLILIDKKPDDNEFRLAGEEKVAAK